MLRERSCAVVAGETDLLAGRVDQFAPVPGDGELARADVEACALELQFPCVYLLAVGLAPGFEAGAVG